MEESIKVFNECKQPLDEQQQKNVDEKHGALIGLIYLDTKKMLEEYKINYKKSNEFILLSIDPKDMGRVLELSSKMGFIKAYQEKPSRLRQTITNVIKRMAQCEAMGIKYSNDDNSYEDFLFRERLFKQKIEELGKSYKADQNAYEEERQIDLEYILGVAEKLYDSCPEISESRQTVLAAVQYNVNNTNLSPKEILLKSFSEYVDLNELTSKIDDVLGFNEEKREGRKAA